MGFLLCAAFHTLDRHLPRFLDGGLMNLVAVAPHLLFIDHNLVHGSLAEHAKLAEELMMRYSKTFHGLYGKGRMPFDVHQLPPMENGCPNWGPAGFFWCTHAIHKQNYQIGTSSYLELFSREFCAESSLEEISLHIMKRSSMSPAWSVK